MPTLETIAVPEAALNELRALYRELTTEMESYRRHCEMRGHCCDFAYVGHMLYLTTLEAAEMARCGEQPQPELAAEGKCPYLRGNVCGARDNRAIGCRLYYCDSTYEEQRNALCEKYLRRAREIEARYGIPHNYQPVVYVNFEAFKQP